MSSFAGAADGEALLVNVEEATAGRGCGDIGELEITATGTGGGAADLIGGSASIHISTLDWVNRETRRRTYLRKTPALDPGKPPGVLMSLGVRMSLGVPKSLVGDELGTYLNGLEPTRRHQHSAQS